MCVSGFRISVSSALLYEYDTSMSEYAHTGVSVSVCVCVWVLYAMGKEYFAV